MDPRLLWLALGGFAGGLEGFLIGSLLPGISVEMSVTIGIAGLVVTGYALAHGFGTPVLAALFGGIDRRKLLAGAELTFAVAALLIALSPQFSWLFVARIALALGAGLYSSTALATAVAISPTERRGRAIGTVVAGQSLAVLIGVPIGAMVAASFGWRAAYFIVAALAFAATAAVFIKLPSGISGDNKTLVERLGVLRVSGMPMALLTTTLFMIAAYMPLIYIAPMSLHAAGVGPEVLPLILFANGIGAFGGGSFGGRIADRLGSRRATLLATAMQIGVVLCFFAVPYLPDSLALWAFLLTMAVAGFVGWGFWPAQASRIAGLAPDSVPLALALNGTALNVGVALCAIIGGATIDRAGAGGIALVALPFAFAALLLAVMFRPTPAVSSGPLPQQP